MKEVRVGIGARSERFVVCVNPEAKSRDEIVRSNFVAYLEKRIAGSDEWSKQRRNELVGELRQTPGVARYFRRTKDHLLRVDKAAIAKDAHSTASGPSGPRTTPSALPTSPRPTSSSTRWSGDGGT